MFLPRTYAQNQIEFPTEQHIRIESGILGETREIGIHFPDDYDSSDLKYPVLYLLDGGAHFKHATGASEFLSKRGMAPDLMIVAVYNIDRNRDFSPVHDDRIPTSGGADKFLGFLSDELKSYMDDNYRTSGYNLLMGHSFGGTFTVYSLLTKPDLFDAYIAVSPYLHFADNYLVNKAIEELRPLKGLQKYFYMTVGDEPDYFEALDAFSRAVKENTNGTVDITYIKMKSENHATIPYVSLFNGLRFAFSDWILPRERLLQGLGAIDAHYAHISSKYGVDIETPQQVINTLGYTCLQGEKLDEAIEVFSENVKRFPFSPNVYDSLGEAYERNGKLKLAGQNYQKAVELGERINDPNLSVYKKNLLRIQQN